MEIKAHTGVSIDGYHLNPRGLADAGVDADICRAYLARTAGVPDRMPWSSNGANDISSSARRAAMALARVAGVHADVEPAARGHA